MYTRNYSVFVVIARNKNSFPLDYTGKRGITPKNETLFCGADKGVIINSITSTEWNIYDDNVQNLLTNSGMNSNSLKVTSKSFKNNGWDWIIVNVGYAKGKFVTRIYRGEANKNGDASLDLGDTNIEISSVIHNHKKEQEVRQLVKAIIIIRGDIPGCAMGVNPI